MRCIQLKTGLNLPRCNSHGAQILIAHAVRDSLLSRYP